MKRINLSLCLMVLISAIHANICNAAPEPVQRLAAYNMGNSQVRDRKVRIIYFYPADGKPCDDHKQRIHDIMFDIREFYRDGMKQSGFGDMTFDLEIDDKGKLVLHEVKGRKNRDQYTQQSAREMLREIGSVLREKGIDIQRETILVISALLQEDGNVITGHKNCPYHGGGNSFAGRAFVSDTSLHAMANLKKTKPMIRAERGRINLGTYASHQIGGYAHELGHAFGLPHDAGSGFDELSGKGHTLMGARGNLTYRKELRGDGAGSYLSAASATRLASNSLFTKAMLKRNTRSAAVSLDNFEISKDDSAVKLKGRVTASPGAYGLAVYVDRSESYVNPKRKDSNYDALSYSAVVDASGDFAVSVKDVSAGRYEVRLTFCLLDGNTKTFRYGLTALDGSKANWQGMLVDWKNGKSDRGNLSHKGAK